MFRAAAVETTTKPEVLACTRCRAVDKTDTPAVRPPRVAASSHRASACETNRPTGTNTFVLRAAIALAGVLVWVVSPLWAQWESRPNEPFDLSETVQLDLAENATLALLERARTGLANQQWEEAIQTLRQVSEAAAEKLMPVSQWRYVSLRDYCQMQLAAMPPEALRLYRSQVDPVAETWYRRGLAQRDEALLAKVVDEALASSWGDDALLALGELALESGDHARARWYWERIVPFEPPEGESPSWPGYPDSNLDLAAVRARLVLTSILEGSFARAREELAQLGRLHTEAKGLLGGREVQYVDALLELLAQSRTWPEPEPPGDWLSFGGNAQRNGRAGAAIDGGRVLWRVALPGNGSPRAEAGPKASTTGPSYFPVVADDVVLTCNQGEIWALRASNGKPAWADTPVVYRGRFYAGPGGLANPRYTLGEPRFTLTVFGSRVYARMGTAVTGSPQEPVSTVRPGYLVCLSLSRQGALRWKIEPEEGWAFEGSPMADQARVYVAMRRSDVRCQAHVACFDAATGELVWRRFVCGAETPGRGQMFESTHGLLTLHRETLYYNTNLGAVAALRTRDGRILWVSRYPRAQRVDPAHLAPHWRRDPSPCLYDRGTLLVAPADSPSILALDAANGQILWLSGPEPADALHLLGVAGEQLIASGGKLYWIALRGAERGRVRHLWPDGPDRPGYGRGLLAGQDVLFPTREKVYVFDQQTAQARKVIDLMAQGAMGGNLVAAGERLLIAGSRELVALGPGEESRDTPGGLAHTRGASSAIDDTGPRGLPSRNY